MPRLLLATVFCCLLTSQSPASDRVLLVGGGASLESAQGQIEANVIWVRDILRRKGFTPRILFNDGRDPQNDLHWRATDPLSAKIDPLALVYNNQLASITGVRNHRLGDVHSTEKPNLVTALNEEISALAADENLWFIYNGHGDFNAQDTMQNALQLWNNTEFNVYDFAALKSQIPPQSGLKYVMTQCFSGAMHDAIYTDASRRQLSQEKICGFTAETAYKVAEGCSASLDINDYRDYSTYFFAAIGGLQRSGRPVHGNADANDDKQISALEAHRYALEYAQSSDIFVASSEHYLAHWAPWPLKYLPYSAQSVPVNPYSSIAERLLERLDFDLTDPALERKLTSARKTMEEQLTSQQQQAQKLAQGIERNRAQTQAALESKWPELAAPYSKGYFSLMVRQRRKIVSTLRELPEYQRLERLYLASLALQQEALENTRTSTQIDKIIRLRTLSQQYALLQLFGDKQEQENYQRLIACEQEPFSP